MKTFKEFQTESYSRLDEGWGIVKTAGDLLNRAGGGFLGNQLYDTVGKDLASGDPERKVKKGNNKGRVASTVIGAAPDKVWKYGVKPAYNLAKWGVTKGIPGAVTTTGKIITALGAMNKMH